MSEHEKIAADLLDWDCVYGECAHDGECPPRHVEVCAACVVVYDEFEGLLPWDAAEAAGHKSGGDEA